MKDEWAAQSELGKKKSFETEWKIPGQDIIQSEWQEQGVEDSWTSPVLQDSVSLSFDLIETPSVAAPFETKTIEDFNDGWAEEKTLDTFTNQGNVEMSASLAFSQQVENVEQKVNDMNLQSSAEKISIVDSRESLQGLGLGLQSFSKNTTSIESIPAMKIDISTSNNRLSVRKSHDSLKDSGSKRSSDSARTSAVRDSKSPVFSPFDRKTSGSTSTSKNLYSSSYTPSKSQTLSQIQSVFNDSQKIAYVGLCYLSICSHRKNRLVGSKHAMESFDNWSKKIMEKLYIYLDLLPAERSMIENLADHGLVPSDLSTSLLQDAHKAAQDFEDSLQEEEARSPESPPMDIRYTILSHLFLLAISDGIYDARARSMLRTVSSNLEISYSELVRLENCITNRLRVYEDESTVVKHDKTVVGERNTKEGKGRWLYAGIGVLAGGALLGVTAGLAAPFIGAGIGAALTTFGVSQGAVVGGFMASSGGIALITGGGVLTGGGMSGKAMINRTRGIEEFEFLSLDEALLKIKIAREQRRLKRLKTIKKEAQIKEMELQKELSAHLQSGSGLKNVSPSVKTPSVGQETTDSRSEDPADLLWEAKSSPEVVEHNISSNENDAEKTLDSWADKGGNDDDNISPAESPIGGRGYQSHQDETLHQTNVLITVSGWVTYDQDDHTFPFSTLEPGMNGDQYTLIWETNALKELGSTMSILASEIASFIFQQGLQATILPVLMGALTGPLWLIKLTYLVDNPWGNALSKAEKAGRLLADTLIGQVQNGRPVTLVGFSIGARLIYYCLLELAARKAYGIIESVYIFGTPCVASKKEWESIMSVVSGKLYNFYNTSDTLLAIIYRSIASFKDVPGLTPVEGVEGIENKNMTGVMNGHMDYSIKMPLMLKEHGFHITSETIFDQDAENEAWKEEMEEEKKRSKEKREKDRLLQIEKLAQDRIAEDERKKSAASAEAERKRLAKEAAIAEKKRKEIEARMKESCLNRTGPVSNFAPPSLTLEEIAQEELNEMAAMEKIMMQYWEPREITSTLPPLVIDPTATSPPETDPGDQLFSNEANTTPIQPPEEELSDF